MTTRSLRDAQFALSPDPEAGKPWKLSHALVYEPWPSVERAPDGRLSVKEICRRFSNAGRELRQIQREASPTAWRLIARDPVVEQLRQRIRNPGIITQANANLCGPMSLVFELARRRPATYVKAIGELLFKGTFTTIGGRVFRAASDHRANPVPPGGIVAADWLIAATMRDDENVIDDIDDADDDTFLEWLQGTTWPFEMEEWTEQVLGLRADYFPCWFGDSEMPALREGYEAVKAGGVAFLLVDSALVDDEHPDDTEEDLWFTRRNHRADVKTGGLGKQGKRTHCADDGIYPNHYVVLMGGLRNTGSDTGFEVKVWCFGAQFLIEGSADGFGEYLWAVITGRP